MITYCSSKRIEFVKPNSLMDCTSCSIWRFGCVRALRGSGLRELAGRYTAANLGEEGLTLAVLWLMCVRT